MFENIIDQGAVLQLRDDIINNRNAPSMLFFGQPDLGKSSAALELARVLSCENDAAWKCTCSSCENHRYLQHDDLLVLGNRSFSAEINACYNAYLRNPSNAGVKHLFFRSLRKLLLRFSPVLMEDDPKLSKISSVLQAFDEKLGEFWVSSQNCDNETLKKICDSLIKDALTLENDGIGNIIPIGQIRKASYWCRLAPCGKNKTLIIENAQDMREEGRNSLLKLLEEPPVSVNIVLTSQRREAIIPTILSRLRPYRFLKRNEESEKEVIRRVFQDTVNEKLLKSGSSLVSAYLNSFMPQKTDVLYPLAAWFIVSLMRIVSVSMKKKGIKTIPQIVTSLGMRYAPIAEEAGFEPSIKGIFIVKTLVSKSGNFDNDCFSHFIKICLELVNDVTRLANDPQGIMCNKIFSKHADEAVTAVEILNINAASALEKFYFNLKKDLIRGLYG
ncbi:MAG: DNA polymerase III [Treponema sp.]|nr:DNA polymerase III [Treponema sp.]